MNNINTKCDCKICHRTALFREFKALLPMSHHSVFEEWYSDMFNDLEAAETDLAMIEYNSNIDKTFK